MSEQIIAPKRVSVRFIKDNRHAILGEDDYDDVVYIREDVRNEANATLIAAAPQLLEACKVALDAINQNDETLTARDYLTAAIEAAEGES